MPARPPITCTRCGSEEFVHAVNPGPNDEVICKRCRARFTYDELEQVADVQFGNDVDSALSRVREVNRRHRDR
jgi:transcription elongation factor Elf1